VDGLSRALGRHRRCGLDTVVFIYHFESHPFYLPATSTVLSMVRDGNLDAVISVVTLMEIVVRPLSLGRRAVAEEYEVLLAHFPHLEIHDADRWIARRAAELRARYQVKPADALQVATAQQAGATVFITNDEQLKRLASELEVLLLRDFV